MSVMSVKSSSSTLTEVPGVNNAVEHLQELASRMKGSEFGFSDDDIQNIENIVEALKDVQEECAKLHEKVETETIKASVLRHRLHFLPRQIKKEIEESVKAARDSNTEELNQLQSRLSAITDNIVHLEKRHKELEQDNAVLHPERDRIRDEHEEIITQLNQRMAEKASKQIVLNETRDQLRETNQKIVDLEEGILMLKEDLIQERADARMEKKRLKKAVYDTTLKTREQKENNVEKKKELDLLHEQVMDLEGQLDNLRKNIRRYDTSRSKLEGQERAHTSHLNKEIRQNQELLMKGGNLTNDLAQQQEDFIHMKAAKEAKVRELEENIKHAIKKNKELDTTKKEQNQLLKAKTKLRRSDDKQVKDQNEVVQKAKQDLAWKAEEAARLRQENLEMENRIVELAETHEAIVSTMKKQVEEYRGQLSKERKDRMELQDERDDLQKGIDDTKVESTRYMSDVTKKIHKGKEQHDNLTKEGTNLQRTLRENEQTLQRLTGEVEKAGTYYVQHKDDMQHQIETMKTEIGSMEKESEEKHVQYEEKLPSFVELEDFYKESTENFDKTKKEIVAQKNKKLALDDNIRKCDQELEKMTHPRAVLKKDIRKGREASVDQLKKQADDVKQVEKLIYAVGCKLRKTMEENHRFQDANNTLETEIDNQNKGMEDNKVLILRLVEEFDKIRVGLQANWDEDNQIGQEYVEKDQVLVDGLGNLLAKTKNREEVISHITTRLQSELSMLSDFLDNVAKRRPKESRKSQKEVNKKTKEPIDTHDVGVPERAVTH